MSKSTAAGTTLIVNEKTVGGCTSVAGIDVTAETIDVTALDNESGFREKEPGFKEVNDIPVSGFLDGDNAGQDECYDLMVSGEIVDCKIVFPSKIGKTWSFKASVTRFATTAEVGGAVTFDTTLTPSGKPTLAKTQAAEPAGNG